jgi:hypothetical protein
MALQGQQYTPHDPNTSQSPKVTFFHHLKINWKFSINEYILNQGPSSMDEPAIYHFVTPRDHTAQTICNIVFGVTHGLSKNLYKQYSVIVIFHGMSHKEALDYCSKHGSSREIGSLLQSL